AWVRELNPDLVIMGKQATDDDCNQAGQMLSAKLGRPQATFACKIELAEGKARVTRETDKGTETLEFELPGVVTTDLRLNEPRYVALPGIIKARTKPLERRAPLTTWRLKTRVVGVAAPPARGAGKRVASVDDLVSELRSKGVLA
ncbi:MAG: electron transfer flavoprotein subunit beta/FixA family protein, partial [Fimbriimonadaceae bacterium]